MHSVGDKLDGVDHYFEFDIPSGEGLDICDDFRCNHANDDARYAIRSRYGYDTCKVDELYSGFSDPGHFYNGGEDLITVIRLREVNGQSVSPDEIKDGELPAKYSFVEDPQGPEEVEIVLTDEGLAMLYKGISIWRIEAEIKPKTVLCPVWVNFMKENSSSDNGELEDMGLNMYKEPIIVRGDK